VKYGKWGVKYPKKNQGRVLTFAAMDEILDHKEEKIRLPLLQARDWRWLLYTLAGVLVFQLATLMRQDSSEFGPLVKGNFVAYFKNLFGYYFLFELVSVFILIQLIRGYLNITGLRLMPPTLRGLLRINLLFLPCVLGSILVFGPITNGLRYAVFFYTDYAWETYFPEYFFTGQMFINYLLPFLVFGYVYLNVNIFLGYHEWQKRHWQKKENNAAPRQTNPYPTHIEARDHEGETRLDLAQVWYFEVEGKNYLAITNGKTYEVRKTLGEWEAELDPAVFFRVNRSTLVNLAYFKNYTFWEYDKYILRLTDDKTEFVMQRTRLKVLKERLGID
jgi:two-component system, LytTR family, response regulator